MKFSWLSCGRTLSIFIFYMLDPTAVTSLCQKGNLSHSRLRNFLSRLTGSGLVNQIEYDGKNTFVITEKGRLFLEEYTKFHEFAGSFGLEM